MISFDFSVAKSHPCLAGHFPGNPVVPGVIIIDEVMSGLLLIKPVIKIINIPSVKFLKILKPDEMVTVTVTEKKSDLLQFICSINDSKIASGQIRIKQANEL